MEWDERFWMAMDGIISLEDWITGADLEDDEDFDVEEDLRMWGV